MGSDSSQITKFKLIKVTFQVRDIYVGLSSLNIGI